MTQAVPAISLTCGVAIRKEKATPKGVPFSTNPLKIVDAPRMDEV